MVSNGRKNFKQLLEKINSKVIDAGGVLDVPKKHKNTAQNTEQF